MRPHQHSKSSALPHRPWTDDLAIHEFLDSTKASCADRRHRLVLHHVDLGSEIAALAFPNRKDIGQIVEQHVTEDLRGAYTLDDWFKCCDPAVLPAPIGRRIASGEKGIVDLVSARLDPNCRFAVEKVCKFLFSPTQHVSTDHEKSLLVLMNAFGPALVRRLFGPPKDISVGDRAVTVDWAWIAEAVIFTTYGRIFDLGEIVKLWPRESGSSIAAMETGIKNDVS